MYTIYSSVFCHFNSFVSMKDSHCLIGVRSHDGWIGLRVGYIFQRSQGWTRSCMGWKKNGSGRRKARYVEQIVRTFFNWYFGLWPPPRNSDKWRLNRDSLLKHVIIMVGTVTWRGATPIISDLSDILLIYYEDDLVRISGCWEQKCLGKDDLNPTASSFWVSTKRFRDRDSILGSLPPEISSWIYDMYGRCVGRNPKTSNMSCSYFLLATF